eukprot:11151829-Alexandrium_andersonii.AAC.1
MLSTHSPFFLRRHERQGRQQVTQPAHAVPFSAIVTYPSPPQTCPTPNAPAWTRALNHRGRAGWARVDSIANR